MNSTDHRPETDALDYPRVYGHRASARSDTDYVLRRCRLCGSDYVDGVIGGLGIRTTCSWFRESASDRVNAGEI